MKQSFRSVMFTLIELLIVVAIIWAVARIIGSMRHKDDEPRE